MTDDDVDRVEVFSNLSINDNKESSRQRWWMAITNASKRRTANYDLQKTRDSAFRLQESERRDKFGGEPIFGNTLIRLQELTGKDVPDIVATIIGYVESPPNITRKGLYRTSPGLSSVGNIKASINKYQFEVLEEQKLNCELLTSLLKQFFKELQAPLFGEEEFMEFKKILDSTKTTQEKRSEMQAVIDGMHPAHAKTFAALVRHFIKVIAHEKGNSMSAKNLCIVWGPTLFSLDGATFEHVQVKNVIMEFIMQMYISGNVSE